MAANYDGDQLNNARTTDEKREGYYARDMNGEVRWYAHPEHEYCDGSGYMYCYCGGDICVCGNQGEIECMGCDACDPPYDDDDDYYDEDYDDDD